MYKEQGRIYLREPGFTLIELLLVVFIIGILTRVTSPYAIHWLRRQQTISYLNEMKEFIRLVRSEARRWGASCEITLSESDNPNIGPPFSTNCISDKGPIGNIRLIQPTPPRNNFQALNQKVLINPRGKIVGKSSMVFVFGYKYNGSRKSDSMFCLTVNPFNSLITEGNFYIQDAESLLVPPNYATNINKIMCE